MTSIILWNRCAWILECVSCREPFYTGTAINSYLSMLLFIIFIYLYFKFIFEI